MSYPLILLNCLLAMLVSVACVAETYKWTDENGRVHFSDTPPADKSESAKAVEKIEINVNQMKYDPRVQERRKKQKVLLQAIEEEDKLAFEKAEKIRMEKEQRQAECDSLKARYKKIKYAGALYWKGEAGNDERTFLEHEERAAYEKNLQEQIKEKCS